MLPRSLDRNATQDSTGQRGLLLVSPRGRIQFKSARAARWLNDFSFFRSDTVIVRSANNSTGIAVVEVYALN